jgi:hypothetical protein
MSLLFISRGHGAVTINEFLAANDGLLRDEDLQSSDWIEIYNSGPNAVNLAGWHLTDEPANLTKWTFPATNLPAGGYLVVFASGKDRAVAGRELHTNFQLGNDGEYLALVQPDGATIAHAYSPIYPNQRANVSFGLLTEMILTPLISTGAPARVLIPTNSSLGQTWATNGFNDSTWLVTNTPIGFNVGVTAAALLALDVNERGQAPLTQAGFTSFVINSNGGNTVSQSLPTTRTYGAITVTVSNTPGFNYNDLLRTPPANSGAFTESLLLRDFLFSLDTGTGGLDINITGLAANQNHRLTIWSFDGQTSGDKVSDWYANGLLVKQDYTFNSSVLPTSNDQYRFSVESVANGSGRILLSGRRDATSSSTGVYLNALKIESLSFQPATNGLASVMFSNNASAFIRIPFTVSNPGAFESLKLRMKYNDGFVAYINGQVVASRNAPASPQWNSAATASRPPGDQQTSEEIFIPNTAGLLQAGANVLAIHGMNVSAGDTNFFILPELDGASPGATYARYFTPPTPGAANGFGYLGLVDDTKFSMDRGFYDTPFTVAITSATASASIYWTTNGSIPSPTNGTLYTTPVSITGTRALRAAAFLTNYVPSIPDAQTYIFLGQVLMQSSNQPGYPTVWQGSYPADYEMDPNIVNHPNYGATISNDLRSIPTLSLVSDHDSFWNPTTGIYVDALNDRGERAASAELFNGDNTSEFQINCGIQMHGQAGRDNARSAKHSFRLEFKSDFGPARLDHDLFDGGVTDFNSLIVRSSWADEWVTRYDPFSGGTYPWPDDYPLRYRPENATYLRDLWVKEAMRGMGHLATRGKYVHVYVNGLYWGIYNFTERVDPTYFANNFGGYEKDWDIMKDYSELQDGTRTDWDNLIALVNLGINSESDFQAVAAQVDIDNLIDYFLLHAEAEANDWLQISNPHNWYGAHRHANPTNGLPATKWIFLPWDQEIAFNRLRNEDRVNGLSDESLPSRIYNQLRAWPEFRRMYGDRVQKHLFNGGALSPSNNVARLQALAQTIDRAIVGESARWGDAREFAIGGNGGTGVTLTRDEYWIPELQKLYTNWFPNVMHQRTIARLQAAGLYPTVAAPEFSQFGGAISNGFGLVLTHTNATGAIFYTLDGSDPREYGTGATAPSAVAYDTPILFNGPTVVRARVLSGGEWSALVEAVFYPPQDLSKLCLNEIMYHPPDIGATSGNNLEFIELKNYGTNTLNLSGLTFSGISFTFTNGTLLPPGGFFVLARNAAAFAAKYPGVTINGLYTGQLDNSGENLTLSLALGTTIFSVTYGDRAPWPAGPDLADFSLVPRNPGASQAPDRGNQWRPSTNPGGSPGADDPAPTVPEIVIDEILTHTDLPQKDAIELFNPTANAVNIGGWFLTDEPDTPKKYRIPNGTTIPANGRIYFDEDDFNSGATNSFALSSVGDDVYLFSAATNGALTGYSHGVQYGGSFNGVSFGRYVNSAGEEFYPSRMTVTLGASNSPPRIGPVVISEIHYHPDASGDEFVELLNLTGSPVPLFNQLHPTNAWKIGGLGFTFPTNVTLGGNATLLLVATNPATFRAKYNVPTNVLILGPYAGQLQDSGENLELQAPDNPNTNNVPYVVIDAVRYNDRSPWPAAADGGGPSLQRVPVSAYGNEPLNWTAAAPTPGTPFGNGDSDGDGMPDSWELANGTFPFVPDAGDDPDQDGFTNLQEYQAGTHPNNPASFLKVMQPAISGNVFTLQFLAASNHTYSVLHKASLSDLWQKLLDVSAQPADRIMIVTNNVSGNGRFFQIVTPAQP